MADPMLTSREKPVRTLLRSHTFKKDLVNVRCESCGRMLFQSFSDVYTIVPGHPDTEIDPALLDEGTFILECHGTNIVEKNGKLVKLRCGIRYFVT